MLIIQTLLLSLIAPHAQAATNIVPTLEKIVESLSPSHAVARFHFKNRRADGTETEYEVRSSIKNIETTHIAFLAPDREKGREVLRSEDVLWTFVPSVGRIIRVEDRDSFAGGDFSNADVLRVDWLNQYNPVVEKETEKQWIVELKAKNEKATYARMRLWIKRENGQPLQQEFFDSKGTLLKRLKYASVKSFGSITRPSYLLMENVITGHRTELRVIDVKGEQKIPESRFKTDQMGK